MSCRSDSRYFLPQAMDGDLDRARGHFELCARLLIGWSTGVSGQKHFELFKQRPLCRRQA
jgi:hypothetical protein